MAANLVSFQHYSVIAYKSMWYDEMKECNNN